MLNTRERLLEVAAHIFVEKGYAKATTREICLAADTNITSIHYYFGSKEELYRAIFNEPFKDFPKPLIDIDKLITLPMYDALVEFYRLLLAHIIEKHHDCASPQSEHMHKKPRRLHMLVHDLIHREQFEPTGLVDDLIIGPAKFIHEPLLKLLCHFLNTDIVDDELHRLAFTLVSIGFATFHPRHIVKYYAPNLLAQDNIDAIYRNAAKFAVILITGLQDK